MLRLSPWRSPWGLMISERWGTLPSGAPYSVWEEDFDLSRRGLSGDHVTMYSSPLNFFRAPSIKQTLPPALSIPILIGVGFVHVREVF